MSKSMAIEGVMKIFLMVAVIIVGMSFLMKAFGIDLFGWLENLFSGLGITEARALYVKLDTDPSIIYNFELTNDKLFEADDESGFLGLGYNAYFYISNFPQNKCTILTDERNGGIAFIEKQDRGGVYHVSPGTILDDSCGSIRSCIENTADPKWNLCDFREAKINPPEGRKCANTCRGTEYINGKWEMVDNIKCEGETSYVDCNPRKLDAVEPLPNINQITYQWNFQKRGLGDPRKFNFCDYELPRFQWNNEGGLINQDFDKDFNWQCGNKCRLLDTGELDKESAVLSRIKIKFGLICDNSGTWQVCKKIGDIANSKDPATGDKKTYKCGTSGGMFVWVPT